MRKTIDQHPRPIVHMAGLGAREAGNTYKATKRDFPEPRRNRKSLTAVPRPTPLDAWSKMCF